MKNNLQNAIFTKLLRERRVITLFTINGFRMKGRITGFDELIVVLEIRNEQQIIYRHAISTITPDLPIDLSDLREEVQ